MRAVGQPLTVEDVEVSEPGPREVLVDVVAAGLCHSDLKFIDGAYSHALPAVLGHESAGVVVAVGSTVSAVQPGDHVVTSLSVFCGECVLCLSGKTHLCQNKEATRRGPDEAPRLHAAESPINQFLDLSSFAEQVLVHENAVVKIDPEVPLDRAALLGCGVATGLGAALNTAGVQPGDSVAVIGCGGVGLSAVQGARIAGATTIIAIDPVAEKLDLALDLGATDGVDSNEVDPVEAVRAITDCLGVDHAIEAVGSLATVEQAFAMTRPGGTATVVGLVPEGSLLQIPTDLLFSERKLQGSSMGSNEFKTHTPLYVDLYLDGSLKLDDLVSGRLNLDQVNHGFDQMRRGEAVRNLIVFER